MRQPALEDLPVDLDLRDVHKFERKSPFVLVDGRKFPNTDRIQTQRFPSRANQDG